MIYVITILFLFSLSINVLLVWYVRRALQEIAPLHGRTMELQVMLEEYSEHIEVVYELPTFYGDDTLQDLLGHSRRVVEDLRAYEQGFIFESEGGQLEEAESETQEEE